VLRSALARHRSRFPVPGDKGVATLRRVATIEQTEQANVGDTGAGLTLTERAAGKVQAMMAMEPAGTAEVLRVAIRGGGCGGFEYALGFDRGAAEGDSEYVQHGVTVVVDPASAPYLKGASVDFVESIQESGFKIENPNASGSCGCGHSFQVEDGAEDSQSAGCGHH
jgi:iron-sulfur cluster assembly accessory protein